MLPETAVGGLRFFGGCQGQGIQRPDVGSAVPAQKDFLMGAVVEEKVLILIAGAEVAPQQREHTVLRFDLRSQDAAVVREADEALQKVGLAVEMPDGSEDGIQGLVGGIMEEGGAFLQ